MALALYPECIDEYFETYICVETKSDITYGQIIYDFKGFLKRPVNSRIYKKVNGKLIKERISALLM
jgi:inosine-uridine nucleoside N-ribohydrolase